MAEHGADMPIPELLRILSADRPRRQAMESWPRYPDPDSVARVSPTAARPGPGRARTAWPPRLGTAVLDHMQHRERSDEWAAWPQIRLGRQLGRVGGQRWESGLTSAHPPWIADWIPIDWAARLGCTSRGMERLSFGNSAGPGRRAAERPHELTDIGQRQADARFHDPAQCLGGN